MCSSLHVTFVVTPRIARFRRRIVEKLQLTRPPNLGKGRIDKPRAGMLPNRFEPMTPIRQEVPMKRPAWKVCPDDLRRIAAKTDEPERERKMLALAEQLEEAERGSETDGDDTPAHTRRRSAR
jgi:hypothetical protein